MRSLPDKQRSSQEGRSVLVTLHRTVRGEDFSLEARADMCPVPDSGRTAFKMDRWSWRRDRAERRG